METHENTLSSRERYILTALAADNDAATQGRAQALLGWAEGQSRERIAEATGLRPAQVEKLTRAFSQKRLEVFAPSSVERAGRGINGTSSVDELVHKYGVDLMHARHVAEQALKIFDETTTVHQLPESCRRLLETGALLHNIGASGDDRHHRAGRDLILSYHLEGFSAQERDILACLAFFHTKKVQASSDPIFAALDEASQHGTLALAAILRVADGLDDSQSQSTVIASLHLNALVDAIVEGPYAESDAARANKKADLWRQVLTPPFYARLSNQALPPPGQPRQVKPKSAIRSHEPMTRAAKKIMAAQFAKLQALEDDVRTSSNIDAVHDMRVATRRLRSAFRLFGAYFSRKTVNRIREPLGKLTRFLGQVRDFDVLIEGLRAYAATLTVEQQRALDPLLADWQARRAQSHHRLVEFLDSTEYDDWIARTEDFIESRDAATRGDSRRVSDLAPARIWKRYGKIREYETAVKQPTMVTLHALRIECKRLRYTLEFFADAMGSQTPSLIEPVVALQDHLGTLHDADVASQLIAEFIAARARYARRHGTDAANFEGVAAYLSALQARITELQAGFPERWHVLVRLPYRKALAEAVAVL